MRDATDEESLLKWLRNKQEKFNFLKNASFELLSEHPNKTINVCQDGPKLLVLPNASDILYCYTSDQWIEKLWSDLRLSTFHYPIIILNILIFLFGTTGNIFVCLSVYRNHQLRNVTNYFIVNLASADFLVILICLPATVIWDLSLTWFFGTIACKLVMFLQDVSISVSVLTLTAISIDRYYAVCYPLKFKSSLNQAKKIIVLIWIVSLILMAPDLIYLSAKMSPELAEAGLKTVLYSDCNYDWSERSSRTFQFVKTILLYLLPLILMLVAHFKIMQTLREASKSVDFKLEQVIATPRNSVQVNNNNNNNNNNNCNNNVIDINHKNEAHYKAKAKQEASAQQQPSKRTIGAPPDELGEPHPLSNVDKFSLTSAGGTSQQRATAVASSAPANITPLDNNTNTTPTADPQIAPADRCHPSSAENSSSNSRHLRQIRFVGSSTGSGQSNAPLSRQSTATTNTTATVNTLPSSNSIVIDCEEGAVATMPDHPTVVAATLAGENRRRLSKSVSELIYKFRLNKTNNRTSFASSTTGENQADFAVLLALPPPPSSGGRKLKDCWKDGSICSNQYEMNERASISNPNQLMMVTMHNKTKLESRRRAAKMLMTIVVMFGVCYLPVHLINFLRQFLDDIPQTDVTSTISMLSHCVCYLNSAINPIIYNHMNSVFRAEFRKFLSCLHWNRFRKKTTSVVQKSPTSVAETQSTRCTSPRRPSDCRRPRK